MSYALLNLLFLAIAASGVLAAVAALRRRGRRATAGSAPDPAAGSPVPPGRLAAAVALCGLVVLAFTAVFDNVIILTGLVAYDPATLLGVRIGVAPVEDFAYALAAVGGLPVLWLALGRRHERR